MEFKGTSGKWYIDQEEAGRNEHGVLCNVISTVTDGGLKICGLAEVFGEDLQAKANAKLISCAPEMLEMLEKCKEAFESLKQPFISSEIEQLIKKATEI